MDEMQPEAPPITYKGKDIRETSRGDLIEAVREAFGELSMLHARLSEEGRMQAARDEDFQRELAGRRDFFGAAAEYQSRMFDAATAYNQLIVIGGYASFFGVWSAFAKDIDPTIVKFAGILILVSMVIYVAWTVVGMYQIGLKNVEATGTFALGIEGFAERIQAAEAIAQQRAAAMRKYWPVIVWGAGLTAFAAAVLLGSAALWTMLPKPAAPRNDLIAAAVRRVEAAATKAECNARVTALYARSRGGAATQAVNPKTGESAVVIEGKWVILPRC